MKRFLFALLILIAPSLALADLVGHQGNDSVRLSEDRSCTHELVLARLPQGAASEFREASGQFQGKRYAACWRWMGDAAFLIYEDGDQGIVPRHELKPDLSI